MERNEIDAAKLLEELGAKPSVSEERGLALIQDTDLSIFSPGISTAGFAEIRMAKGNAERNIVATTIDKKGLEFAEEIIKQVGLQEQIETKLEDLRSGHYPPNTFDVIYARLVLHYLSAQDLDSVLAGFAESLKQDGRLFAVVRSEKNLYKSDPLTLSDPTTKLTSQPHYNASGTLEGTSVRYFHTPESITEHLKKAGFQNTTLEEYEEQLYKDFMRKEISPVQDHVIEVVATKASAFE